MTLKDKVVIIGSGLGGLECGYILARHGFNVTVLERAAQIGGCLQTFQRRGTRFDTGFHYVGGLDEGQPLNRLFRYFDLLNLPWHRLDEDCFDEVVIGEESFPLANGHERFSERLIERFPAEKEGILKYTAFLKDVGDHIFDSLNPREAEDFYGSSLFARSAYDFLNETVKDPLLRKVLSGNSLKMELNAESLPLYVYAQINNSFIQSAWRLRGGGSLITGHLAASIREMGGRVITNAEVVSIDVEDGHVARVGVRCGGNKSYGANGGMKGGGDIPNDAAGMTDAEVQEKFEADWVISNAHPAIAVSLVRPIDTLRNIYRKRITNLANTFGMFTANIALKEGVLPYLNRNIFIHNASADLWRPNPLATESVLVSYSATDGDWAPSVDLLSPMGWDEVSRWADMSPGQRGDDYAELKQKKLADCLKVVGRRLPELRRVVEKSLETCAGDQQACGSIGADGSTGTTKNDGAIGADGSTGATKNVGSIGADGSTGVTKNDGAIGAARRKEAGCRIYTSTPLSYNSYLGQPQGGAYGIRKDWRSTMTTVLTPSTPVQNLLLTGQSLNLHGVLGVSMSSIFTCAAILGMDVLSKEILG